jgi:Putative peptidoglycan binding domain/L,D-transpeptidase catalytic domain
MAQVVRRWLYCIVAVAAVAASIVFEAGRVGAAPASGASATADRTGAAKSPAKTTPGSASTETYAAPPPVLRFGAHGPAIRNIQQRLNQLGYFAGPADGRYGNDLREAVWAFKEVQGLPMNARSNSDITVAFRQALLRPRQPYSKYQGGGAGRIEINLGIQVLVLYRDNAPHLILHISSGGGYYFCASASNCGHAVTPDGSYTALSYLPGTITVPLGFMRNPVFFIGTIYAIHGGEPVPWYPDSHGCVRISDDAVNWFHNDVQIGSTPIYIFGTAPYRPKLATASTT